MSGLAAALLDTAAQALLAGFIVFLRVGAAAAVLPAFGEQVVPQRVRLGLALGATVIVAPAVAPEVAPLAGEGRVVGPFVATEVLIGLAIGLCLRLFVLALQVAGTIAAQSTSLSQIFGGMGGEPMPAMSQLLVLAGLALAVMAGLHVRVVELLVTSYQILPPGRWPSGAAVSGWGLGAVARVFALAFAIAMPFVIAALVYNLALGVINRAMPQLMVSFVGAPALTLGGLALLALAAPSGLAVWSDTLSAWLDDPFQGPR